MNSMETPRQLISALSLALYACWFTAWPAIASEVMQNNAGAKNTRQVLPAEKFVGRAALGYKCAAQAPDLMEKLFCYCGCDITDKHHSLLDCYTSDHSEDCQICQDEAIMAVGMLKQGKSVPQIQKSIDNSFSGQYPWSKPTQQLLDYQKTLSPNKEVKTESKNDAGPNTLKPGAKLPNCCGGHSEK